jgi:hypothetical protein
MAGHKKIIHVDFFQVEFPKGSTDTFDSIVDAAIKKPLAQRSVSIGIDFIRLETASNKDGVTKGDFGRIRMNDLPSKAAPDSTSKPIPLADDEGVVEQAAFLYHSATQVLLLQRSRFVFPSTVVRFLEGIGEIDEPILFSVVLEPNAAADFKRLTIPQKLDVSIARLRDPRKLGEKAQDSGESLNGFLDIVTDTKAKNAHLVLTAGRGDHKMSGKLKTFARNLLSIRGTQTNDIRKLQIVGTDENEVPLAVDLVRDRMLGEGQLTSDGRRRLSSAQRIALLEKLFDARKDELTKAYS